MKYTDKFTPDFNKYLNEIKPFKIKQNLRNTTLEYPQINDQWISSDIPEMHYETTQSLFYQSTTELNLDVPFSHHYVNKEQFHFMSHDWLINGTSVEDELSLILFFIKDMIENSSNQTEFKEKLFSKKLVIAVNSDLFLNIAKIRALKVLIHNLFQASSIQCQIPLSVMPDYTSFTIFEPELNLNRIANAAFVALITHCEEFICVPFDFLGMPMKHSIRSSLLSFNILKDEAHLNFPLDAAYGSNVIEELTNKLITQVWNTLKQNHELRFEQYVSSIEQKVLNQLKEKQKMYQNKKISIVGGNQFVDADAKISTPINKDLRFWTYDYEVLRQEVKNKSAKIQLIYKGQEAHLINRINFCKNYFETIGVMVEEVSCEHLKNISQHVILCSADEEYEAWIPEFLSKYKTRTVFVAGKCEKLDHNQLKMLGIYEFIYLGQDQLSVLQKWWGRYEN